jgi:hypothetical protein
VPEQLTLDQILGNRATIQVDEGFIAVEATGMNAARDQLFSRTGRPMNQRSVGAMRSIILKSCLNAVDEPKNPSLSRAISNDFTAPNARDASAVNGFIGQVAKEYRDDR